MKILHKIQKHYKTWFSIYWMGLLIIKCYCEHWRRYLWLCFIMYKLVYKSNLVLGHNSQVLIIGSLKKKKLLLNLLSFIKQRIICLREINLLTDGHMYNEQKLIYSSKIKFYSPRGPVLSTSNCYGEVSDFKKCLFFIHLFMHLWIHLRNIYLVSECDR